MIEELLTPEQVCKALKISKGTLRVWKAQGKIPFVKLPGKTIRYRKADIANLILHNTVFVEPGNGIDRNRVEKKANELLEKIFKRSYPPQA